MNDTLLRPACRLLVLPAVLIGLGLLTPLSPAIGADTLYIYGGGGGGGGGGDETGDGGGGGGGDGGSNINVGNRAGAGGSGGVGGGSNAGGTGGAGSSGSSGSSGQSLASGGSGGEGGGNGKKGASNGAGGGRFSGTGGDGGEGAYTYKASSPKQFEVLGGNGGNGGNGNQSSGLLDMHGMGGNGGNATLVVDVNEATIDSVILQGGNHGKAGDGGKPGGNGGKADLDIKGKQVAIGTVTMKSGEGYSFASLNLSGDVLSITSLTMQANSSNIGALGTVRVDATGKTLSVDTLVMESGPGNRANFNAATLKSGSITLNQNVQDLTFKLSDALVWNGDGVFAVTGDTSYVRINSLTLDGGTVNKDNYGNLINGTFYTDTDITLGAGGATFDTTDGDQTVGRKLVGTGSLAKIGSGTLTLTGDNTYTGTTTVNAGTLQIGDGGTAGSVTGDIVNNAALVFNRSDDSGYAGTVSGTGSLTKEGAGTLTLTGNNTYTGGTTVSAGTLQIGDGGTSGSMAGDITNNAALVFNRSDASSYTGVISGTGSFEKAGAGMLTLTGNNTYTGTTTVSAGTLQIGDGGTSGSMAGDITNNAALVFNRSDTSSYAGVVSGTGSLTKEGAGTLTLTGNNTYSGDTVIQGGTLALSGAGTLGASSLLDLRGGRLDIGRIAASSSLTLPSRMDVHGASSLILGNKTADFSGRTLSFYVPSTMTANSTLLYVSGPGGTMQIGGSTVQVGIEGASSPLANGDTLTLINVSDGTLEGNPTNTRSDGTGMQGVTLHYDFDITRNGNRLTATLSEAPKTDERAKALSEGVLSGVALANMGSDTIAGAGMDNARQAAGQGNGAAAFGAIVGGSSRYDTGSHVDVDGVSTLVGLAGHVGTANGSLLAGAFFEYGYGHTSTHNGFSGRPAVNGGGQSHYVGGGVMARFDTTAPELKGLYLEGSLRAGRLSTDWHSNDLLDAAGNRAQYETAAPYYGAHAGLGWVVSLTDKASLDVYGKYFWTHLDGDSLHLSTGDPVEFGDTDSHRLKLGTRFGWASGRVTPYLGLAWEHEFDGKARATAYGLDVPAPAMEGDTGVVEVGVKVSPSGESGISFNLAALGYTGAREGVSGTVQLNYAF